MPAIPDISWSAVVAGLPALGAFYQVLRESLTHGGERRLKRHMELLALAPAGVDTSKLKDLVEAEASLIAEQRRRRLTRKIDWVTVITMFVVLSVSTGGVLGLWWLSNNPELPGAVSLLCRMVAVFLGASGFLLASVGGGTQLWKSDEGESDDATKSDTRGQGGSTSSV